MDKFKALRMMISAIPPELRPTTMCASAGQTEALLAEIDRLLITIEELHAARGGALMEEASALAARGPFPTPTGAVARVHHSINEALSDSRRASIAAVARNAALEEAAVAAEAQNRTGYEWVKDSLWDIIIIARVPAAIRKLKSNQGGEVES